MKYRAGIAPPRSKGPKRLSEYQLQYKWKDAAYNSPLLAAEQVCIEFFSILIKCISWPVMGLERGIPGWIVLENAVKNYTFFGAVTNCSLFFLREFLGPIHTERLRNESLKYSFTMLQSQLRK